MDANAHLDQQIAAERATSSSVGHRWPEILPAGIDSTQRQLPGGAEISRPCGERRQASFRICLMPHLQPQRLDYTSDGEPAGAHTRCPLLERQQQVRCALNGSEFRWQLYCQALLRCEQETFSDSSAAHTFVHANLTGHLMVPCAPPSAKCPTFKFIEGQSGPRR